ncbi:hypothetical protein MLD38_007897 [Melastoma candidum]|uniref:Uncharacterized protein n=1 Tax=Melastoma candidum TaxID=119954 RepID=A0ACB9RS11_9MYRT|nr:hypothetical protein MLD38_007897 [Melastoma candidum]
MSEGTPKLYANKPKKAQIKQAQTSPPPSSASPTAASMGTPAPSHAPPPPPPQSPLPPPPPPAKEPFARRYKFLWPLLLAVNIAVGAYLFMRTSKKDTKVAEEEEDAKVAISPPTSSPVTSTASVVPSTPVVQPMIAKEPIPPSQQRELFKWMLEEKRKTKPKDAEERKHIDEEKAILKQFIRAKSIPNL